MPERPALKIVRYSGDEGRDRAKNPSINAPHSYREALVAVLLHAQYEMKQEHREHAADLTPGAPARPTYTGASRTQKVWVRDAYAEGQKVIGQALEALQEQMKMAGEDRWDY